MTTRLDARTRLFLVDDHAIVRRGLRAILEREPDLEIVGEAADPAAALPAVAALHPDLVLLDVRLAGETDGLELCGVLTSRHPEVAVVMLTTFLQRDLLLEALRRGASGYVLKDVDVVDLVRIIRAVRRGESGFDPRTLRMVVRSAGAPQAERGAVTARERQVVGLIARGRSNREIGAALFISESTVKFHVRNVMRKLAVGNRAEVVYASAQLGLL